MHRAWHAEQEYDSYRFENTRLPRNVEQQFDTFLCCSRLEYVFMLQICGDCKHQKRCH
jgi:hypothetical protein